MRLEMKDHWNNKTNRDTDFFTEPLAMYAQWIVKKEKLRNVTVESEHASWRCTTCNQPLKRLAF